MKENNKKILILSIIGTFFIIIGVTYAYFAAIVTGNESVSTISLDSGTLSIVYADNSSDLSMSNIYPKTEPWISKVFTLTGNNSTTQKMNYKIVLSTTMNTFPDNYLAYKLIGENVSSNGTVGNTNYEYINGIGNTRVAYGVFAPNADNAIHRYTLNIYFLDNGLDQNDSQESYYKGKVYIQEAGIGETPVERPAGWVDAINGTLLAGMKINNPIINTNCSVAGKASAETDEGLCAAEDDYGTTYYYRGVQNNNYVSFAGMCWRIVRVDGKGNTKLVLYNNGENLVDTTNPCAEANDGTTKAQVGGGVAFNSANSSNAYVGFMYGAPNAETYDEEHNNSTKSNILNQLITFYNDKLYSYENVLADVVWCNDKSINDGKGTGTDTNVTYYTGYDRLNTPASATATFNCLDSSGEASGGTSLSRFTSGLGIDSDGNSALNFLYNGESRAYKIGLLTADEVAFAGARMGTANSVYYLNKNATGRWWWTMTPHSFSTSANEFSVNSNGGLGSSNVNTTVTACARPFL